MDFAAAAIVPFCLLFPSDLSIRRTCYFRPGSFYGYRAIVGGDLRISRSLWVIVLHDDGDVVVGRIAGSRQRRELFCAKTFPIRISDNAISAQFFPRRPSAPRRLCPLLRNILLQISIVASIPFRFKAGGNGTNMPSSVSSHSHRSTTKASHKPFKSRKATKGAIKEIKKGLAVGILG